MSKPVYLVMPQWQGSGSSRAMRLIDGAQALREDLPARARFEVPVPDKAGDSLGTPVARLSSVLAARDAARDVLDTVSEPAITVGGDCASSLPGIEAVVRAHGSASLAVLWFDAHPDLQHPSTSPSGAASGMTLRHALGDGSADLASAHPIDATQLTLVGTRAIDAEEADELERRGIRRLDAGDDDPEALAARVTEILAASGASRVYVHVDLDVLDPGEFEAVHAPVPFGLSVAHLTAAIRAAVIALPLAGAAICEFAPSDPAVAADDLPTVLRILAALTSASAS